MIREGPYFICVICNRCLFKRYIVRFDFNSYSSLVKELVHLVSSCDGRLYICITCHLTVKKDNVPCQAISNKLAVELLPNEFRDLRRLERVLVAKRILFKKVQTWRVVYATFPFPKLTIIAILFQGVIIVMGLLLSNLKGKQRTVDMYCLSQLD